MPIRLQPPARVQLSQESEARRQEPSCQRRFPRRTGQEQIRHGRCSARTRKAEGLAIGTPHNSRHGTPRYTPSGAHVGCDLTKHTLRGSDNHLFFDLQGRRTLNVIEGNRGTDFTIEKSLVNKTQGTRLSVLGTKDLKDSEVPSRQGMCSV